MAEDKHPKLCPLMVAVCHESACAWWIPATKWDDKQEPSEVGGKCAVWMISPK